MKRAAPKEILMTEETLVYCDGVILGELEIQEIEEVVAPGAIATF
jgi:hypothetical protein